jgi:hypothetical protein
LQSRKQLPKLHQCFHRNLRRAEQKLCALWIQHPGRNSQSAAIVKLAHHRAFTGAPFLPLVNAERLTEERMPTIADRYSLKKMGIM